MIGTLLAITVAIHTKDVLAPPPRPPLEQWSASASTASPTTMDLRAADGTALRGWLVPAAKLGAPWVIFFYGSNENCLIERNRLDWLASIGANAVCVDYRGYGFSGGVPSGDGIRADALAVFDAVKAQAPAGARLFVYGWSVGTQFAIHVAATRAVAGVILQAPPASADAMDAASRAASVPGIARWAVRLKSDDAVRRIYQGAAEAKAVTAPLLVIEGASDVTVPPAQARQVFAAAASADKQLVIVDGADHNHLRFTAPPASTAVEVFLRR